MQTRPECQRIFAPQLRAETVRSWFREKAGAASFPRWLPPCSFGPGRPVVLVRATRASHYFPSTLFCRQSYFSISNNTAANEMRPLLNLFKDLSNVFAGHTDSQHVERAKKD